MGCLSRTSRRMAEVCLGNKINIKVTAASWGLRNFLSLFFLIILRVCSRRRRRRNHKTPSEFVQFTATLIRQFFFFVFESLVISPCFQSHNSAVSRLGLEKCLARVCVRACVGWSKLCRREKFSREKSARNYTMSTINQFEMKHNSSLQAFHVVCDRLVQTLPFFKVCGKFNWCDCAVHENWMGKTTFFY